MLSYKKRFAPCFPGLVKIGEVGYVHDGGWERLFDAVKALGDESNDLGVPEGYCPLLIGKVRTKTIPEVTFMIEGGTELEIGTKASSPM